jgi:hypothetical protein
MCGDGALEKFEKVKHKVHVQTINSKQVAGTSPNNVNHVTISSCPLSSASKRPGVIGDHINQALGRRDFSTRARRPRVIS